MSCLSYIPHFLGNNNIICIFGKIYSYSQFLSVWWMMWTSIIQLDQINQWDSLFKRKKEKIKMATYNLRKVDTSLKKMEV
jgi:hypothetical protein